mgnify:CR=1 FL=1
MLLVLETITWKPHIETAMEIALRARDEGRQVLFCNLRRDTGEVVGSLEHYGFAALALHGDMAQRDRPIEQHPGAPAAG